LLNWKDVREAGEFAGELTGELENNGEARLVVPLISFEEVTGETRVVGTFLPDGDNGDDIAKGEVADDVDDDREYRVIDNDSRSMRTRFSAGCSV